MLRSSLFCSILAFLALSTNVSATNYYFSSSIGSDSNSGTSPTSPWQSTNKFNDWMRTRRFASGDNVYFCQGDTWLYAHLASEQNGVTYDSYNCRTGRTAKPVLSTSIQPPAAAWSRVPGNTNVLQINYGSGTYRDTNALNVGFDAAWVDQVRYMPARWPQLRNPTNTLTVGQTTWGIEGEFFFGRINGTILYCPDLTQGTDYWKGAVVNARILNYAYLPYNVVSSGPGYVELHHGPGHLSGFFITHASGVSTSNTHLKVKNPGEFSFDQRSGMLYLYPLTATIASNILSGSQPVSLLYKNLPSVFLNQNNARDVTVRNLHFRWAHSGISSTADAAISIISNDVSNIMGNGIQTSRMQPTLIQDNYVFDAESACINAQSTYLITKNTVKQCGLYAGYGLWQGTNGITTAGWGETSYNDIQFVGYIGLAPSQYAYVLENRIDYAMMTLNDGGGIYGYGQAMQGVGIYNNIISNVIGNWYAWTRWQIAPCMYMDSSAYVTLSNNTCSSSPSCVQMNNGDGHTVMANVCNAPGMYINQARSPSMFMGNLVATTGTNTNIQNPLHRVQAPWLNVTNIMTAADNIYCIPQGLPEGYLFQMVKFGLNSRFNTFQLWKDEFIKEVPSFERGTAVYSRCNGMRSTFYANEITGLPIDMSAKDNKSAVKIAVPVVLVSLVVVALIVGMVYRSYRKQEQPSLPTTNQSLEIELPQSSPTSASTSSFSLMSSSPRTVMV